MNHITFTSRLRRNRYGSTSQRVLHAAHTERTREKSKAIVTTLDGKHFPENAGNLRKRQPLFLHAQVPTVSGMNQQPQPLSHAAR